MRHIIYLSLHQIYYNTPIKTGKLHIRVFLIISYPMMWLNSAQRCLGYIKTHKRTHTNSTKMGKQNKNQKTSLEKMRHLTKDERCPQISSGRDVPCDYSLGKWKSKSQWDATIYCDYNKTKQNNKQTEGIAARLWSKGLMARCWGRMQRGTVESSFPCLNMVGSKWSGILLVCLPITNCLWESQMIKLPVCVCVCMHICAHTC